MHLIAGNLFESGALAAVNCWSPTLLELDTIARVVVGTARDHWVRKDAEWVFAAKTEFGSAALKLEEEFAILAREVKSVMGERSNYDGALRAAAFYHLRFAGIHPLFDGNGRVGRALMAMQCSQSYGIPLSEILTLLDGSENEYRAICQRRDERQRKLAV